MRISIIVLLLFSLFESTYSQTPCGAVLYDNFDDALDDDWSKIQSPYNITTEEQMLTFTFKNDTPKLVLNFSSISGQFTLSFTYRNTTANHNLKLNIKNAEGTLVSQIVMGGKTKKDILVVSSLDSKGLPNLYKEIVPGSFVLNTEYTIQIVLNTTTRRINAFLNGEARIANALFINASTEVSQLEFIYDSLVRVNQDYYMAFSRGDGMIIWHSRDLMNWEPILHHNFPNGFERVWAVDLQYFEGKFHLYIPVGEYPDRDRIGYGNFVLTATNAEGPWSDPIFIDIPVPEGDNAYSAIDPGFIMTPKGEKYLYVNHGWEVKLNDKGTKAIGIPQKVYEGWHYPDNWVVQCKCLESPKLFMKDGYYYLVSAQGGTSGPSTAHMTIVARSKSPTGPWKNSPYNPITHTYSNTEKWWHQGHGTIFEAVDGTWWTVYHARLNGYENIGRQTLLMPIEWTNDGWPIIKDGIGSHELIQAPQGDNIGHGMVLSDDFNGIKPGIQWSYDKANPQYFTYKNSKLYLQAQGNTTDHRSGRSMRINAVNKSFEITTEIELEDTSVIAGISLDNDGILTDGQITRYTEGPTWRMTNSTFPVKSKTLFLKIKSYRKDVSFYYSIDGINWTNYGRSLHLNTSNIRLFAAGKGQAIFHNFVYQGLE